ncbi:MAG: hypothetical protein HKN84_14525 [Gammaproteobacteria bacterium]|nr:hypothetical protein [Gammaproteobacteria bacterium]
MVKTRRTVSHQRDDNPEHPEEFVVGHASPAGGDVDEASFDPETAEQIWHIAARLQAEAARRLDDRSRAIAASPGSGVAYQGFTLSEVKMIGDEAGIDPQFIELALRQHAAQAHAPKAVSGRMSDAAGRFLGTPEDRVTVTRVIRAGKEKVLEAMERIFPKEPFNLQLLEVIGDDQNLADSTLIFKVPQVEQALTGAGLNMFAYRMSIADLNRMTVTFHSIDEERTEVSVQLDLKYGKWRNLKLGASLAGASGLFAGFIGFAIAMKKTALGILGATGIGLTAALVLGLISYFGFRLAYRSGLRKGRNEMEDLLALLDVNTRTGGGFGAKAQEM